MLVGLGFAVKVSDVLVGLGLAVALVLGLRPAWRRVLPVLAAFGAGFLAIAGAAVAIGGSAMLDQSSRASDMVSIGSPWRVIRSGIHLVVGGSAATDILKAGAIVLAVVLAVLLVRGLPGVSAWPAAGAERAAGAEPSPGDASARSAPGTQPGWEALRGRRRARIAPDPGQMAAAAGVVFGLVLAWLFAWPYVLPWYDTLAWALLPLVPLGVAAGANLDWIYLLVLARTAALGFGYLPARQADVTLPAGLTWLQPVIRHGITPAVLAAATVWLIILMLRPRSSGPPPPAGSGAGTGGGLAAADPATTAPEAARASVSTATGIPAEASARRASPAAWPGQAGRTDRRAAAAAGRRRARGARLDRGPGRRRAAGARAT